MNNSFDDIFNLIEQYDSIVIFGHKNPDGDCYGSAVAMKAILSIKYPNKRFYIVGSGARRFFKNLSKMDNVSDDVIRKSMGLLVDMNDLERSEDTRIYNCLAWAKIDHHVDTGTFKEGPQVVFEEANSTCDIIVKMVQDYDLQLNVLAANALYLGILTDTGRFQFVTDYPTTFERVSYLCRRGADPKLINKLLSITSERELESRSYVLSHYKRSEHGVLYIKFPKDILHRIHLHANMASGLINLIGNVEGYPIWASFAEYDDGKVRVELRSNGPAVQPIAASVGGGGHRNAAGATLSSFDDQVIMDLVAKLDLAAQEFKKGLK